MLNLLSFLKALKLGANALVEKLELGVKITLEISDKISEIS